MSTLTDNVVSITVTVAVDIHGVGHVTCTPYSASVTAANTTLQFNMTTPGWVFPDTNPVYLTNGSDPNFPNAAVKVSGTQVTWLDTNSGAGDFAYTACAVRATGGDVVKSDPIIHNTGT